MAARAGLIADGADGNDVTGAPAGGGGVAMQVTSNANAGCALSFGDFPAVQL